MKTKIFCAICALSALTMQAAPMDPAAVKTALEELLPDMRVGDITITECQAGHTLATYTVSDSTGLCRETFLRVETDTDIEDFALMVSSLPDSALKNETTLSSYLVKAALRGLVRKWRTNPKD